MSFSTQADCRELALRARFDGFWLHTRSATSRRRHGGRSKSGRAGVEAGRSASSVPLLRIRKSSEMVSRVMAHERRDAQRYLTRSQSSSSRHLRRARGSGVALSTRAKRCSGGAPWHRRTALAPISISTPVPLRHADRLPSIDSEPVWKSGTLAMRWRSFFEAAGLRDIRFCSSIFWCAVGTRSNRRGLAHSGLLPAAGSTFASPDRETRLGLPSTSSRKTKNGKNGRPVAWKAFRGCWTRGPRRSQRRARTLHRTPAAGRPLSTFANVYEISNEQNPDEEKREHCGFKRIDE